MGAFTSGALRHPIASSVIVSEEAWEGPVLEADGGAHAVLPSRPFRGLKFRTAALNSPEQEHHEVG